MELFNENLLGSSFKDHEVINNISELEPYLKVSNKDIYPEGDKWVFRGMGDSDWHLEPSYIRGDRFKSFMHEGIERKLDMFYRFHHGLISSHRRELRKHYIDLPIEPLRLGGEHKVFFDSASFAQHYGVPTLLLDWSFDPLMALWFAIEGWLSTDNTSDMALWLFNTYDPNLCFEEGFIVGDPTKNTRARFSFFEPSYDVRKVSEHCKYQRGLHSYINIFKYVSQEECSRQQKVCNGSFHQDTNFEYDDIDVLKSHFTLDRLFSEHELFFSPEQSKGTKLTNFADKSFKKIKVSKHLIPDILQIIFDQKGTLNPYPSYSGCGDYVSRQMQIQKLFPNSRY
ncbi:MAG: FRG domain-containing protein [Pseudomonadales bacterium]|nr:FRG domain-containing protein [Pseudomonadales bacterium]